jgi:hypothetical protein
METELRLRRAVCRSNRKWLVLTLSEAEEFACHADFVIENIAGILKII